jgi:hypothetical protein
MKARPWMSQNNDPRVKKRQGAVYEGVFACASRRFPARMVAAY